MTDHIKIKEPEGSLKTNFLTIAYHLLKGYSVAMLIYGKNAVIESLRLGQAKKLFLAHGLNKQTSSSLEKLAKKKGVTVAYVPRIELDQNLKTTRHQGIVAELPDLTYQTPDAALALAKTRNEHLLLILLDQINDPRNYGAIIRSAEALGAHGVVTEERRSAPLSAVAVKAAAGATSHIPLINVKNLPRYIDELKKKNVWVYGSSIHEASLVEQIDWQRDTALVIGSEGTGMRRLVRDKCDELIYIPLSGHITSLNASVAAGILIHDILKQRKPV